MGEECFLRREAYQATKAVKPDAQAVVWEKSGLPEDCRACARDALTQEHVLTLLDLFGVELDGAGEPSCDWGMSSDEGMKRRLVLDAPQGENGYRRRRITLNCPRQSGSIVRQPKKLAPNPKYL